MPDCSAIAELDRAVSALLSWAGLSARRAPVDVRRIAKLLELDIRHDDRAGAEGQFTLHERRAVIVTSSWGSEARQRFTIAHELGHAYLLHPDRGLSGEVCRRWPDDELFCNDFAASLLLPRPWLTGLLARRGTTLGTLRAVAQRATVSLPAASLRLLRSGLWQYALTEWRVVDGRWVLSKANGIDHRLRGQLMLAQRTDRLLGRLAKSPGRRQVRLQLVVGGERIEELVAEVEVARGGARMLVPVDYDGSRWRPRWLARAADDASPGEQTLAIQGA
jgi:IrrE N-terminal-like domain